MKQNDPPAFRLARNSQQGSPLVQLPTELRLEILRILLKKHDRLPAWEWCPAFGFNCDGTPKVGLSPQILSSCQALYEEAYHVLYQENTISICFSRIDASCTKLYVSILGAVLVIEDNAHRNHFFHPFRTKRDVFNLTRYESIGTSGFAHLLEVLARFTHVNLSFRRDSSYLIASRTLAASLRDKCVVVDLGEHYMSSSEFEWYSGHPFDPHFSAACFAIWQCSSIKFRDGCQEECCSNDFSGLTEIIVNKRLRVRDLCADFWRLDDALRQSLVLVPGRTFTPLREIYHEDYKKIMTDAIHNSDVRAFKRLRRHILTKTDHVVFEMESRTKSMIECNAFDEISSVEQYPQFTEEERSIWIDYILSKKELELARIEEKVKDYKSLVWQLVDEDELWNDQPSEAVSADIILLDRAFYPFQDNLWRDLMQAAVTEK